MWRTASGRDPHRGRVPHPALGWLFPDHRPTFGAVTLRRQIPADRPIETLEQRVLLAAADLDPMFGTGGKLQVPVPSAGNLFAIDVTVLADGQVMLAGGVDDKALLIRLTPAGAPDPTFGPGGDDGDGVFAPETFPAETLFEPSTAAFGPDGKVTVAGSVFVGNVARDWAVARLNLDGTFDPAFGPGASPGPGGPDPGAGRVVLDGVAGQIRHVLPLAGGKTLLAGDNFIITESSLARVVRLNADGSPDGAFGTGGVAEVGAFGTEGLRLTTFRRAAVDSAGRVIVTGSGDNRPQVDASGGTVELFRFEVVARFTPQGQLDRTYGGGDGVFASVGLPFGLLVQPVPLPDGRVLVGGAGRGEGSGRGDMMVTRLLPNGSGLDPAFGASDVPGVTFTDSPDGDSFALTLDLLPGGRILAAGVEMRPGDNFALARYNADGTPDLTFNNGSDRTITTYGGAESDVFAVAVAPDGRVVATGIASSGGIPVARYLGSPLGDPVTVVGTDGPDRIRITQSGATLTAVVNGRRSTFGTTGAAGLVVRGLAGDDRLFVDRGVTLAALLDGGGGHDTLHGGVGQTVFAGGDGDDTADFSDRAVGLSVSLNDLADDGPHSGARGDNVRKDIEIVLGGQGDDAIVGDFDGNIFVGNGGKDVLRGGVGNDILIGGRGADRLFGGSNNDLLIGARTIYDAIPSGLRALRREWRRIDETYEQKVGRLRAGVGGVRISSSTVIDDFAQDLFTGGFERDWFVFNAGDTLGDRQPDEVMTTL